MTDDFKLGRMSPNDDDSSSFRTDSGARVPDSAGATPLHEIWGPRAFTPYKLEPGDEREGTAMDWVERALIAWYFLQHDNTPATITEVRAWVDVLTPDAIFQAVEFMARVGLP